MPALRQKLPLYLALIRFHRPIGTLLVLWPTLWALWLAAAGLPPLDLLLIFSLGAFLTRSAGCIINDIADRNFDGHVARTVDRPLATGQLSVKEALWLCLGLTLLAFVLVLFTNGLTILLSFGAVILAACYPFLKRFTHWPQLALGAAFAWSIPMAFAAVQQTLPGTLWWLYFAVLIWTVGYDTFYAMVDRDDDLKVGIKSTAVLFGRHARLITLLLQLIVLAMLWQVGRVFQLSSLYWLALLITAGMFSYQQWLLASGRRDNYFRAFLHNNWVGLVIFLGIALDLAW